MADSKLSRQQELQRAYKAAAHKLNQRMRRIEQGVQKGTVSRDMQNYAFRDAVDLAKSQGKSGYLIKESIPRGSIKDMTRSLREVQNILDMTSSSIKEWNTRYNKAADTISKKFDADFSADDVAKIYEDGGIAEFFGKSMGLGSNTTGKVVAEVQKQSKELKDYFSKMRKNHRKLDPSQIAEMIPEVNGFNLADRLEGLSAREAKRFVKVIEAITRL